MVVRALSTHLKLTAYCSMTLSGTKFAVEIWFRNRKRNMNATCRQCPRILQYAAFFSL